MNLLAVYWDVDPVIFSIWKIDVRYYSLFFIIAFAIGYYIFKGFFKREGVPLKLLDPLLYTLILGTLVGARLGHCFFYQPDYYLANPIEILYVWEGGLASHGGAIALLLAMWWFARHYGRKYQFNFLWIMDRLGIATALAGFFIRMGNLMNSEIYGNETTLPWGFIFLRNGEVVPKHPTQLYEALSYLLLFVLLLYLYRKKLPRLKEGTLFGLFLLLLFAARFFIEYIKEPQVAFEETMALNMGQLLSIPFIFAGAILLLYSIMRGRPAMRVEPAGKQKVKKQEKKPPLSSTRGTY
ncbi:MAG TPA: prolipoprotein diacylglyceryl transferase [Bacteroidales bacterium]|jgi:prolipoprotein diacylglyceryl transferase|nr:prolipoprotein diacylglyceryl transferase [Bacteroidales bacterium]MCZ2417032.1 prolipoprotein diacylglyceryl transferase [Burkholderiales bacterium]OQC56974.1 MAG: Prolipoprotein diacylglyceryl transferase [Bacteroidetes bacterium ADurb.Bin013]MBP8999613.1 prolipoprotein diacylglyceryl transferase [Bacteroidales bacterium]MBV6456228.1 Prolipoprotein diacylglyceryl transferase [Bacteroidales bacterium]